MKKFFALVLVLAITMSLAACASAEFKSATELVGALAETEITVDSAEAVNAARAAYDLLTEDEKAKFELYDTLTAAEDALAEAEAEAAAYAEFVSQAETYYGFVMEARYYLQTRHTWFEQMWNNAATFYGDTLTGINVYNLTMNAGVWESLDEIEDFCEYSGMALEEILAPMVLLYEPSAIQTEMTMDSLKSLAEPHFAESAAAYETYELSNSNYLTAGIAYGLLEDYADTYPEDYAALTALNDALTLYYNIAGYDMTGVDSLDSYLSMRSTYIADLDAAIAAVEEIING